MRLAVLAHHVVAHQRVHQSGRLMRGEDVDAFILAEDVVAPDEHGRSQLRYERDRLFLAHPRQMGIGIGPERGGVYVEMRGVGHGGTMSLPGSTRQSIFLAKTQSRWVRGSSPRTTV